MTKLKNIPRNFLRLRRMKLALSVTLSRMDEALRQSSVLRMTLFSWKYQAFRSFKISISFFI